MECFQDFGKCPSSKHLLRMDVIVSGSCSNVFLIMVGVSPSCPGDFLALKVFMV